MPLQVRRGTNSQRTALSGVKIPAAGELLFTTDTKLLYVGDGATVGGVPIGNGNLPANTGNLLEGSNLYYTDARARSAISVSGSLSYNSTNGVISYTAPNSTSNLQEGTNLYYTNARARNAISVNHQWSGNGELRYDNSSGKISSGLSFYNYGLHLQTQSLQNYINFGYSNGNINFDKLPGLSIGKEKDGVSQLRNLHIYVTDRIADMPGTSIYLDYVAYESVDNGIPNNILTIDNITKFIFLTGGGNNANNYSHSLDMLGLYNVSLTSKEDLFLILTDPNALSSDDPGEWPVIAIYKVNAVTNDGSLASTDKIKIQVDTTFVACSGIGINDSIPIKFYSRLAITGFSNNNVISANGIGLTWKKGSELSTSIRGALRLDNCVMGNGKIVFPDNTVQTTAYQVVTAPTTATSSGITGQIAYDSNYVYICTATNTWKRSALSSW